MVASSHLLFFRKTWRYCPITPMHLTSLCLLCFLPTWNQPARPTPGPTDFCRASWCSDTHGGWVQPPGQLPSLLGRQIIIHSTGSSKQSVSPRPRHDPFSTPSSPSAWIWSWSSSHAGRFKSPLVYRIKLMRSWIIHCFLSGLTKEVWKETHCYISACSF